MRQAVETPFQVVALDYGCKRNILRCLADVGCRVTVVGPDESAEAILAREPDGIFLANGPGDPAATGETELPKLRALVESGVPLFGICLGHQMLALALGARTIKMRQGHHGANHPVKDHTTGKVEIVSMNHGFAVDAASLAEGVEETHISLFDGSNCGLRLAGRPVFSVQHHPEASPGPRDSHYLFRRFRNLMAERKGLPTIPGGCTPTRPGVTRGPARRDGTHALTITLVRHLPVDLPRDGLLSSGGMREWLDAYERASVRPPSRYASHLLANAGARTARIVSSPQVRALETLRVLTSSRRRNMPHPEVSDLLREVPLPRPAGPWRLRPAGWLVALRCAWLLGAASQETRQQAGARARDAAGLLQRAATEGPVVAVGHGWQGRQIALTLKAQGWRGRFMSSGRRGDVPPVAGRRRPRAGPRVGHGRAWTAPTAPAAQTGPMGERGLTFPAEPVIPIGAKASAGSPSIRRSGRH